MTVSRPILCVVDTLKFLLIFHFSAEAVVGLQFQSYTVNEASGVATVCAELIDGEIERDIVASLSTLADGTAQGQRVYMSEVGIHFDKFNHAP